MVKKLMVLAVGLGLAVDVATLTKQAESGDINARFELAKYYYNQKDYTNELIWEHKLAYQGYAVAQYNLGVMYRFGLGVQQDYNKAFYWYSEAANQGHSKAQNNLGVMYYNGYGVKQNYVLAME